MRKLLTLIVPVILLLSSQTILGSEIMKDFKLKHGTDVKTGTLYIEAFIPVSSTETVNGNQIEVDWAKVYLAKIEDKKQALKVELNPKRDGSNIKLRVELAPELNGKYELQILGYYGHKKTLIAKKLIKVKIPN